MATGKKKLHKDQFVQRQIMEDKLWYSSQNIPADFKTMYVAFRASRPKMVDLYKE